MIKNEELEFLKLKEARIDFLECDEDLPPVRRPLARIAETAQIFTAMDLYNARAELDLEIEKAENDLKPALFKLKVQNLKNAYKNALEEKRKLREQYNDEILILEDVNGLNITEVEREYQLGVQKRLQEEANKEVCDEPSV